MVRADEDDNTDLYGPKVAPRDVVMSDRVKPPAVTEPFMTALRK
jgi:lipid-binding SYLF domain-containing protein